MKTENKPKVFPSDDEIIKKAKGIIPEDLYRDCGGFVTIEDRNESKRRILIEGIKIGLHWQKYPVDQITTTA